MFFGEKLKDIRLRYKKVGLTTFAKEMEMNPSDYNDIEKGYAKPPSNEEWIDKVLLSLLGEKNMKIKSELYSLWKEPFRMQKMPEIVIPGLILHHADGSPLTADQLNSLVEWTSSLAKEHNIRADEYNEQVDKDINKDSYE